MDDQLERPEPPERDPHEYTGMDELRDEVRAWLDVMVNVAKGVDPPEHMFRENRGDFRYYPEVNPSVLDHIEKQAKRAVAVVAKVRGLRAQLATAEAAQKRMLEAAGHGKAKADASNPRTPAGGQALTGALTAAQAITSAQKQHQLAVWEQAMRAQQGSINSGMGGYSYKDLITAGLSNAVDPYLAKQIPLPTIGPVDAVDAILDTPASPSDAPPAKAIKSWWRGS